MSRAPNLRQIEAFKAIIETGTVSEAAAVLGISQPAASKLLAHLEADSGLVLFERRRGRLAPTARGMRLYEEIDRIFSGVRQLERAIESIRRQEQGQLTIGVMPGLAGPFIARAILDFRRRRPNVYVSVVARSSQFLTDWLVTRQVDVGVIALRGDNPHLATESVLGLPLVCVMPPGHPLAARDHVTARDLADQPLVSFAPGSDTRRRIEAALARQGVTPKVVLDATTAPTVCELVALGLGVTLLHPLFAEPVRGRVVIRRFEPATPFDFLVCRPINARNGPLVEEFVDAVRRTAAEIAADLLSDGSPSSSR